MGFYINDKILIEDQWTLIKFIIFYHKEEKILIEFLILLNRTLSFENGIEFIARGTPSISALFFCLKNMQNHKQNLNETEKDCCCIIIKILRQLLEKTSNSDFTLINLKSNEEIQLFIKKFGFKQLSKISKFFLF